MRLARLVGNEQTPKSSPMISLVFNLGLGGRGLKKHAVHPEKVLRVNAKFLNKYRGRSACGATPHPRDLKI